MHKIPLIVYFEQMRNTYICLILITRNFNFEQTLTAYRTHLCEDLSRLSLANETACNVLFENHYSPLMHFLNNASTEIA